jgi:Arc/MetJ-type ribon-helix-helix transcriptional regulator
LWQEATKMAPRSGSSSSCLDWPPNPGFMLGMSTHIAVRLPDELVAYVDQAVAAGRARSRADLVSRLLARDARRQRAEDDLQRLIEGGSLRNTEALAMALATSGTPVDDD